MRSRRNPTGRWRGPGAEHVSGGGKSAPASRDTRNLPQSSPVVNRHEELQDPLLRFGQDAKGCCQMCIVEAADIGKMALSSNPEAKRLLAVIENWITACIAAEPGQEPLCLDCGGCFGTGALPAALAISIPFADPSPKAALVSGICHGCAERAEGAGGLYQLALRGWQRLWPDARLVEGGHG